MREQDSGPEPAGTGSGPARPGRLSLPSRRITATRGTGAASGSGKLLATELGKRGARLVLGDINMDALDKLVADLDLHFY